MDVANWDCATMPKDIQQQLHGLSGPAANNACYAGARITQIQPHGSFALRVGGAHHITVHGGKSTFSPSTSHCMDDPCRTWDTRGDMILASCGCNVQKGFRTRLGEKMDEKAVAKSGVKLGSLR